jgi:DNA repair exonuclease SbcCD ATPase subunit
MLTAAQIEEVKAQVLRGMPEMLGGEERFRRLVEGIAAEVADRASADRWQRVETALVGLTEAQSRTENQVKALAEAQSRTENQVKALAEAQSRTEVRVGRLEEALDRLAEAQARTEAGLAALTERVDRLAERMDQLTVRMDQLAERMDQLTVRMDQLTERMDQLTVRMDQLTERMDQLAARMDQLTERMDQLAARMDQLAEEVGRLTDVVGRLRGDVFELKYRDRVEVYFGPLLRRVKVVHKRSLEDVLEAKLTHEELLDVLRLDLLVGGQPRRREPRQDVLVAAEVSAVIDRNDVDRARRRSELLRKAGFQALPAVAGEDLTRGAEELAAEHRVAVIRDGSASGWEEAVARWLAPGSALRSGAEPSMALAEPAA